MQVTVLRKSVLATSVLLSLSSTAVFATNGLAPVGLGMEHRALGGAGVGYAANTTSLASNPASASFVADGYDVGLELFRPNRGATRNDTVFGAPADSDFDGNGKKNFFIPEAGYKRGMKNGIDVGIAVYGNGGMNSQYDVNPGFGVGRAGVDLQQLFIAPTVSYKMGENSAIGVSANLVYQKFKAEGLQGFDNPMFSSNPGHVTNNGYDSATGIGATLGWQGKVAPNLTLGVAYRTKVSMGKFDKYSGLFADGGKFSVPAAISGGFAWQAAGNTTIVGEVQQVKYSDVGAIGNSSLTPAQFGSSGGPGFGWSDVTTYKLGLKQQVTPDMAVMVGYNKGDNPIKNSETTVNVLAPATTQKHLTLGAEYKLSPNSSLIGTWVHTFEGKVEGNNQIVTPSGVCMDCYDLRMKQDAFGVAYSHRF